MYKSVKTEQKVNLLWMMEARFLTVEKVSYKLGKREAR